MNLNQISSEIYKVIEGKDLKIYNSILDNHFRGKKISQLKMKELETLLPLLKAEYAKTLSATIN